MGSKRIVDTDYTNFYNAPSKYFTGGFSMADVVIEKGIEVPKPVRQGRYPWGQMEVGDSFQIEGKEALGSVYNANKTHKPKHFIARKNEGGVRIWRDA